jgi:signal transduction histidine kinase
VTTSFLALLGLGVWGLGAIAWRRGSHPSVARAFAAFAFALGGWVFGIGGVYSGWALEAWARYAFASASLLPACFLVFTVVYPQGGATPRWLAWPVGLGGVLALASLATPLMVHHVQLTETGLHRETGPLYVPFAVYFLLTWLSALVVFLRKWRRARGLERLRLYYLATGLVVATVGGVTANLVIPFVLGTTRFTLLGPYFVLPLVALVSHAIIRHRLLDLRVIVHRGFAFVALLAVSIAAGLGILRLAGGRLSETVVLPAWAFLVLSVLAVGLSAPLAPRVRRGIDAYLLRGRADLDQALRETARRLARVVEPREIAEELQRVLTATVAPELQAVLVTPPDAESTVWAASDSEDLSPELVRAAWNVQAGAGSTGIVFLREGEEGLGVDALRASGFELWIGLGRAGQRLGVVLLGSRVGGEAYVLPLLRFLEDLVEIIALALDTAQLYKNRVLLERERERSAHLDRLGRTYASLGHEIRTPLTTIANVVSMLPDRLDDPEYRDLATRVVPGEVQRIVDLAERLRSMRPSARPPQPVALESLLRDVVALVAASTNAEKVEVQLELPPSLPEIVGDSARLVELFRNLLDNALEASGAGGHVLVRARHEAAAVRVEILDEGTGIMPEVVDTLFEPFVSTKVSGRGLGLSICREIATEHSGNLSLVNRTDRAGAIAVVRFPAGPALAARAGGS